MSAIFNQQCRFDNLHKLGLGGQLFTVISAVALGLASANASAHAKLPEPKGPLANLFSSDDYPDEALEKHEQGDVGVLVQLDAVGAVSDCTVDKSSGSTVLDRRTCEVIRERAKFKPVLDRKGRAIASHIHETIRWRIGIDWAPNDPWVWRMVTKFGPYGDAVSCRIDLEGAMEPKPGSPPPRCAREAMQWNVGGDKRFGGAIDRVTVEQRFVPGPQAAQELGPDEVLFSRQVLRLDVDATGKLNSCKVTERTGSPQTTDPCAKVYKAYSPRKGPDGKPGPFSATQAFTTLVHLDRTRPPESAPLSGSLQGLIAPDDYPAQALDRGDQGRVGILIRTDPKGAVSDCVVEETSGSILLDKQTCDVVRQRGKFKPALNGQGLAVAGEYRTRINWKIADDMTPSDPWITRAVVNFASDGRALSCHMEFEGAMKPQPGAATPECSAEVMANAAPRIADLPNAIATVVIEQRFAIGSPPARPLAAGDVILSKQVLSLDVNADGALTSCKVIENSGQAPQYDPCAQVDKTYLLHKGRDGRPVGFNATETFIVYLRFEKVALGSHAAAKEANS